MFTSWDDHYVASVSKIAFSVSEIQWTGGRSQAGSQLVKAHGKSSKRFSALKDVLERNETATMLSE